LAWRRRLRELAKRKEAEATDLRSSDAVSIIEKAEAQATATAAEAEQIADCS
jgi:hypothetical protein